MVSSCPLICFILVRHTNNIIKDKTTPSSVTVEVFTTSILNTLCKGVVLSFIGKIILVHNEPLNLF
jgi:hypothetical protein